LGEVEELLADGVLGLGFEGDAVAATGIAPFAAENGNFAAFVRRGEMVDAFADAGVIRAGAFGRLAGLAVRMDADRVEVLEDAGGEEDVEEFPVHASKGGADDGGVGLGLADGLGGGDGEGGVFLGIGGGFPEVAVGLVEDFPDDVVVFEMDGGCGGPTGKGGDAFGMAGRGGVHLGDGLADGAMGGDWAFIERIGVIKYKHGAEAAGVEIGNELVVIGKVVLAAGALGCGPSEVHADEFEAGVGDHVEITGMPGGEMDVDADALGQHERWELGAGAKGGRSDQGRGKRALDWTHLQNVRPQRKRRNSRSAPLLRALMRRLQLAWIWLF